MADRRRLLLALLAMGGSLPLLARLAQATTQPAVVEKAGRVIVLKRQRILLLMRNDRVLRSFRVALGRQPWGPRPRQGDFRTPEGEYRVAGFNPQSSFYRAI